MTSSPACFGCGDRFDRSLLEEVGDALFCRPCLGRLLSRVEEREAAAAPASASPARAVCFLCSEPLEGEPFVRLGGFAICDRCSRPLAGPATAPANGMPTPRSPSSAPARGRGRSDAGDDNDGIDEKDDGQEETATPGAATERCAGCGRAMPGPGSYQLIGGRPHCPACAADRPPVARPAKARSAAARPRADEAAPGQPCDACRRRVEAPALRLTRGFQLCSACLATDAELALDVAQARHRRRLERQGRRLLGKGDDD